MNPVFKCQQGDVPLEHLREDTQQATWEIILGWRCSLGGSHGYGYYPKYIIQRKGVH